MQRAKLQEATWQRQASDLGLDGDEYVAKLREQQRVREQRLAQKYAAAQQKTLSDDNEDETVCFLFIISIMLI